MSIVLLLGLIQVASPQAVESRIERIADVRVDADRDREPDRLGDTVTIAGRASSSSTTLNRDHTFLFMQDRSAGIAIYSPEPMRDVATGDSVVVTGIVHQYAGLTQLHAFEVRVLPGERNLPSPIPIGEPFGDLERHEGRLVQLRGRVKGVERTVDGQFLIVGAESSLDGLHVFISAAHSNAPDLTRLRVGDEVALTGLLAQHDVEPPYDTRYQIFPRSQEDLQAIGLSRARIEAALLWAGALLFATLLWLVVLRVQVRGRTRELRETARRFQALIENAYEIIMVLDAKGTIRFSSRGSERNLGLMADQLTDQSIFALVHPDDLALVDQAYKETVASPRVRRTFRFRARHHDGSWRTLSSVALNLLDDPAIGGIVMNSRDETEQQALESQLLQSKKLEAIGRVAGGVAHDFNNLMTIVLGNTEMLLAGPRDDDGVVAGLTEIKLAVDRASSLTRQLLAFSRKQVLQPRVVDLAELVREMNTLLRRLIGEDIGVELRIAEDVGHVSADPTQLEQVVLNLAVNARDAMPTGGKLVIGLDAVTVDDFEWHGHAYDVAPGDYVVITVADTGTGIDPDVLEHIFDPFFTTKRDGEGTGLGLATVYGVVKQSGGYIWVDSDRSGTTFRVYLPRTQLAPEAKTDPRVARPPRATAVGTILLAEDEPTLRAMTQRILEREGYVVLGAANGAEALLLLERAERPPDLLLTDVVMPLMGGRELAERFATLCPDTIVLFMSGYMDDHVIRRGILAEGRHFLAKPFSPDQLLDRVAALTSRSTSAALAAPLPPA